MNFIVINSDTKDNYKQLTNRAFPVEAMLNHSPVSLSAAQVFNKLQPLTAFTQLLQLSLDSAIYFEDSASQLTDWLQDLTFNENCDAVVFIIF